MSNQNRLVVLNNALESRADEFKKALPSHITPARFQRSIMTAVQSNPDIMDCDQRSVINACMKAAQDGLLPDGREAALVSFKQSKKTADGWVEVKLAQYMPMVYGIRKKILQSGEITDIQTGVVYKQEIESGKFIYEEGTERTLRHKPELDPSFDPSDDDIAAAYSVATFKDGSKSFEVMPRREINKVRQASQTGAVGRVYKFGKDRGKPIEPKGPWVDWFSEMARKSAMRRHSKTLPMSGDVLDTFDQGFDERLGADAVSETVGGMNAEPMRLPSDDELGGGDQSGEAQGGEENADDDSGEDKRSEEEVAKELDAKQEHGEDVTREDVAGTNAAEDPGPAEGDPGPQPEGKQNAAERADAGTDWEAVIIDTDQDLSKLFTVIDVNSYWADKAELFEKAPDAAKVRLEEKKRDRMMAMQAKK